MNRFSIIVLTVYMPVLTMFSQVPRTSISKNKIELGEEVRLTYSIAINSDEKLIEFEPNKKILSGVIEKYQNKTSKALEIVKKFSDSIIQRKSTSIWRGVYRLVAWDTGTFIIKGASIKFHDSIYRFPPVELKVSLAQKIKNLSIYDIRESFTTIDESFSISRFLKDSWWWMLLVLLVTVGWIILSVRRKRKNESSVISFAERSIQELEKLAKKRLWEKGKLKEHFIQFSMIFRSYLSQQHQINLLDKTTKETILILKRKKISDEHIRLIEFILNESDMVKFAKSTPNTIDIESLIQTAICIIKTNHNTIANVG